MSICLETRRQFPRRLFWACPATTRDILEALVAHPEIRLAQNLLPRELHDYSIVTFPQPDRISSILKSSYNKLLRVDSRNDSQVMFYDELGPGHPHWAWPQQAHRATRQLSVEYIPSTIAAIRFDREI